VRRGFLLPGFRVSNPGDAAGALVGWCGS